MIAQRGLESGDETCGSRRESPCDPLERHGASAVAATACRQSVAQLLERGREFDAVDDSDTLVLATAEAADVVRLTLHDRRDVHVAAVQTEHLHDLALARSTAHLQSPPLAQRVGGALVRA